MNSSSRIFSRILHFNAMIFGIVFEKQQCWLCSICHALEKNMQNGHNKSLNLDVSANIKLNTSWKRCKLHHVVSTVQRKKSESWPDLNPWPSVCWADALTTKIQMLLGPHIFSFVPHLWHNENYTFLFFFAENKIYHLFLFKYV